MRSAIAQRHVPVGEQRGRLGAIRARRSVLGDHRQREPRAQIRAAFADAVEEAEVLGEAAERDVLAVVGRRRGIAFALRQRLHRAAERRARLVQRHVGAARRRARARRRGRRGRRRRPPAFIATALVRRRRASPASRAGTSAPKTSKPFASMRSSWPRRGRRTSRRRARCGGRASRAGAAPPRDAPAHAAPGTP